MTAWHWESRWPAPAKLNLFLHVVGRREDGYHLLQTVFRFIDLADALYFSPRTDGRIVLATPTPGVAPESDLTVRAARLLQAQTGTGQGATIHLEKCLPMGGGLGGGSSDAATVLIALNHLWQTGCPQAQLAQWGLTLGADVPVFLHGRNCFAEGIGERFTDVPLPPASYLILHPGIAVPTAAIFGAPELRRNTPPMPPEDWREGLGINDLQAVACQRFPAVREALDWLRERAPTAMMTGSGACLFARFPDQETAAAAAAGCPPAWQAWVARGLPEHPLAKIARGAGIS